MNREFRLKQLWVAEVAIKSLPLQEAPADRLENSNLNVVHTTRRPAHCHPSSALRQSAQRGNVLAPLDGKASDFKPM